MFGLVTVTDRSKRPRGWMSRRHEFAGASDDEPAEDEIWNAYRRIIDSGVLKASGQLDNFLRFVIERTLEGDGDRLKAYTIAVEALGRSASFDPNADALVRITAGRLRKALAVYYAADGADDPLVVDLPRGSYVPTFTRRSPADDPPGETPRVTVARLPTRRPASGTGAAAGIVLLIAAVAGWSLWLALVEAPGGPAIGAATAGASSEAARIGVTVAVLPLEVTGAPAPDAPNVSRLGDTLADAIARFDALTVVSEPTSPDIVTSADYRLTGRVDYQPHGTTRLAFRLTDVATNTIVWSRTIEDPPAGDVAPAREMSIASEVVTTVAGPFGVIWAREFAAGNRAGPYRRCLVETIEYWRRFSMARHATVRACMTRIVEAAPAFALAHMALGLVYLREYYMDIETTGELPAIDLALLHAQRALELRPQSARAHNLFSAVSFAQGDTEVALATGARGMELNPYDTNIVAEYGCRLLGSGEVERGMEYLRRAAERSVARPAWFDSYIFLGAYITGDTKTAASHGPYLKHDQSPLGLVARIVAAEQTGDRASADEAVALLLAINPTWRDDPRALLAKFFTDRGVQERLLPILLQSGLGG